MRVIPVTPERLPHAADVLARAFLDDPMTRWSLGGDLDDRTGLERRMAEHFRIVNEEGVRRGWLWETPDGSGVAVWLPPEAAATFADDDEAMRPALAPLTDDGAIRYGIFWDWIGAHVPADPVWYLDQIGVEPGRQGQGIGSALITHGLGMAAERSEGAFLETGNPRNVAYYEQFGFRVVEDSDAPDGGPHIWFMKRMP